MIKRKPEQQQQEINDAEQQQQEINDAEQQQQEINDAEWLRRREEQKRREQKERDAYQREKFGVVTYERRSEDTPKVRVVPVEIEVSWALDEFVKHEILDELAYSYRDWVQECYLHRMRPYRVWKIGTRTKEARSLY